jgi:hypothetical protein
MGVASSRDHNLLVRFTSVVTAHVNRDVLLKLVEQSDQAFLTKAAECGSHDGRDVRLLQPQQFPDLFLTSPFLADRLHHLNAKGRAGREGIRIIKPKVNNDTVRANLNVGCLVTVPHRHTLGSRPSRITSAEVFQITVADRHDPPVPCRCPCAKQRTVTH